MCAIQPSINNVGLPPLVKHPAKCKPAAKYSETSAPTVFHKHTEEVTRSETRYSVLKSESFFSPVQTTVVGFFLSLTVLA